MFSELERDALTELVNIAVSGAAARLRVMVGSEIKLTVPAISVISGQQAGQAMIDLGLSSVTAVRQSFMGRLSGETMLVFPEGDQNALVRAVLGAHVDEAELEALAGDALCEIGNVLLLGFLATIGRMLEITFDTSLPVVVPAASGDLFGRDAETVALFIYVNFSISGREVRGYFALVLGVGALAILRQVLSAFIDRVS